MKSEYEWRCDSRLEGCGSEHRITSSTDFKRLLKWDEKAIKRNKEGLAKYTESRKVFVMERETRKRMGEELADKSFKDKPRYELKNKLTGSIYSTVYEYDSLYDAKHDETILKGLREPYKYRFEPESYLECPFCEKRHYLMKKKTQRPPEEI